MIRQNPGNCICKNQSENKKIRETKRLRKAADHRNSLRLHCRGIESCDDVANLIRSTSRRIRSFQHQSIKKFRSKVAIQKKMNYIIQSLDKSHLQKKISCLPIREIERDLLEFNGSQLFEYGFKWKLYSNINGSGNIFKKYKKLCLNKWIKCCCNVDESRIYNIHKYCIISQIIQSFILGMLCMKMNQNKYKDMGYPQKNQILNQKNGIISEEAVINLILRIKYQSLCINITNVSFDLFNRDNNNKNGYLSIKPSLNSISPSASSFHLYNILFQSHDSICILKNQSNHKNIFFGIVHYDNIHDSIKIRVHHKNIANSDYDIYDKKQDWMLFSAPYCVKHAISNLFQSYINNNSSYKTFKA